MFGKDFELRQGVGGDECWEAAVPSGDSKVDESAVTLQMLLRGFEGLLWPETQTPACLLDASF